MKYPTTLILLFLLGDSIAADPLLKEGWHEVKARTVNHQEVVVRAEVGPVQSGRCSGWRWGAENECPRTALLALTVVVGRDQLFIPRSAFADLGSPTKLTLTKGASSLDVVIKGGDAALSYTATLKFSRAALRRRAVFGNEFDKTARECTTYSYPN